MTSAADVLRTLIPAAKEVGVTLSLVPVKKGTPGTSEAEELIEFAKGAGSVAGLLKQKQQGPLLDTFLKQVSAAAVDVGDAQLPLALLLSIHDTDAAKQTARKSGYLTSMVMKQAQLQLESFVDKRKAVKHSEMSKAIEEMITNPSKSGIKLKGENCDFAYLPVVQSGGQFELRVGAESSEQRLHHGVIMLHFGCKYLGRITNICRTFFVNPDATCAAALCRTTPLPLPAPLLLAGRTRGAAWAHVPRPVLSTSRSHL